MAKVGLNNFRYGILTEAEDGTPSYNGAHKPAKAVSCNVSITNNSAKLFADDGLAESDTSFQSGTVTMGLDEDNDAVMADMLGHTISQDGEMVRNANDSAPYVGLGRILVKMVNGVYKFKVEFLYKVKFSEPSQENNTKGESLEFGTTTIEGLVSQLANGDWSKTETFSTQAEALAYLESLLGGTPPTVEYNVIYNANGGTGTVESVVVEFGDAITLDDGTGLTAPEGKEFAGWATTPTATAPNVTSPFKPTADVTLYAVWVDAD
jgi:phi13 family phage major tail protein